MAPMPDILVQGDPLPDDAAPPEAGAAAPPLAGVAFAEVPKIAPMIFPKMLIARS